MDWIINWRNSEKKREKIIIRTSIISIVLNIVLVGFKALVGFFANSIAIISDAINNLSDVISSIIAIAGTKFAAKKPDKEHPYGHGRIEYIASFIISAIIIYAGIAAFIESCKKIIKPEEISYNKFTIIVIVSGILVKLLLGIYVKKKGKLVNSDTLIASGVDALNDAIVSISVLASGIIYLIWNINLEAYVGVLVSIIIFKTGIEMVKDSINDIVGYRIDGKMAIDIKNEIMLIDKVNGVFDLLLNNYGPDKYYGSVHVELPDTLSVSEVDHISREITERIMNKFGVIIHTVGVYSINTKNIDIINIRKNISDIVFSYDGIIQMHGFYINEKEKNIKFDIIIDYKIEDRDELYNIICEDIKNKYPDYKIDVLLDFDVSD